MESLATLLPEAPTRPGEVFDVVLVSGDAYVDHPAFGTALIGRYLESLGYRVGVLAQPSWTCVDDFRRFGRPRLFFGVSAGNLDSIVAHYTPDRRRRRSDAYSPGGETGRRPDYATVVYAQRCREAYPEVPVVLGGLEASLRRLPHYDYVQQKVRGSVLVDAKADYLVYGMAERTLAALAEALGRAAPREDVQQLPGLAYRTSQPPEGEGVTVLPVFAEVAADPVVFLQYFQELDRDLREAAPPRLVQAHGTQFVVVNPPAEPLTPRELDAVYRLPFTRSYPERYAALGGIPALEPVRFSVVTHRGCYGGCSFCAITAHQGRAVVSRPEAGVVEEVRSLTRHPEFRGTLQDLGGPTANMYGTHCGKAGEGKLGCERMSCLVPDVCPHLEAGGARFLKLLRQVRKLPGVKHAFVASGLRHDLLLLPGQRRLLRELMQHHVGGQMKVAPEHVSSRTLRLMGKPYARKFREFQALFDQLREEVGKPLYLVPYLMTGHPGCDLRDSVDLARFADELGHFVEQVQDFTPTPMTRSTCMFHTGVDPTSGDPVLVPRGREKRVQRALAQHRDPANRKFLTAHFQELGKAHVLRSLAPAVRPPRGGTRGAKPAANRGRPRKPGGPGRR